MSFEDAGAQMGRQIGDAGRQPFLREIADLDVKILPVLSFANCLRQLKMELRQHPTRRASPRALEMAEGLSGSRIADVETGRGPESEAADLRHRHVEPAQIVEHADHVPLVQPARLPNVIGDLSPSLRLAEPHAPCVVLRQAVDPRVHVRRGVAAARHPRREVGVALCVLQALGALAGVVVAALLHARPVVAERRHRGDAAARGVDGVSSGGAAERGAAGGGE
ncbi:MAG: hypothetical protein AAFR16_07455, partial [Pseudomonadota bacterium]